MTFSVLISPNGKVVIFKKDIEKSKKREKKKVEIEKIIYIYFNRVKKSLYLKKIKNRKNSYQVYFTAMEIYKQDIIQPTIYSSKKR